MTLLKLKNEIISSYDTERLLELEINLKHFMTIYTYKLEEAELEDDEQTKDLKNSLSLAKSYLSVINWKLSCIKLDKENEKIKTMVDNKSEIYDIFEMGFENFLVNHSTSKTLKNENSELKKRLNDIKMSTNSTGFQHEIEMKNQEIAMYKMLLSEQKKELKQIKETTFELYNDITKLIKNSNA